MLHFHKLIIFFIKFINASVCFASKQELLQNLNLEKQFVQKINIIIIVCSFFIRCILYPEFYLIYLIIFFNENVLLIDHDLYVRKFYNS